MRQKGTHWAPEVTKPSQCGLRFKEGGLLGVAYLKSLYQKLKEERVGEDSCPIHQPANMRPVCLVLPRGAHRPVEGDPRGSKCTVFPML